MALLVPFVDLAPGLQGQDQVEEVSPEAAWRGSWVAQE